MALTSTSRTPVCRRLAGFAFDPSLAQRLDTFDISAVTFRIPWEDLAPGPVGEYIEVIDVDPTTDCFYAPVDLNDPVLLADGGLPPSQGTPQFHQQMVYAVASLTIRRFEIALGRKALWSPRRVDGTGKNDSRFVRRLRVYPHAMREANAYYSPDKKALLFGYFRASDEDPGEHLPGSFVFGCLSHDIVAHETAHALLDGMHRKYNQPTNPDVQAFHEAFADVVALLQHFTYPEIVRDQIARTRGGLRNQGNLLGELATEFGRAMGSRGALRDYIGRRNPQTGAWEPRVTDPDEYERTQEPHERGAILVAAIFDAFLSIYERRTADLVRLATSGSGVLPAGNIHPDLVNRLAQEAAKSAEHVLNMCIRALDYCPPVDLTFGEYLRAIITADHDLVKDDDLGYRVAFTEAFRRRAIYPRDVRALSEDALLWRGLETDRVQPSPRLLELLASLREHAQGQLDEPSREELFHKARALRRMLHGRVANLVRRPDGKNDAKVLGIDPGQPFEVHSARFAERVGPDGQLKLQCIIELLQRTEVRRAEDGQPPRTHLFEGGSTVILGLRSAEGRRRSRGAGRASSETTVDYLIRKSIMSEARRERQLRFQANRATGSLWDLYFGARGAATGSEPFAALHRG